MPNDYPYKCINCGVIFRAYLSDGICNSCKALRSTDTAPVKSEETTKLSFPLALLRLSLGMARTDLANDKKEGLNPSPELERIPQIEYAIRILEAWPEVERVLGEYGDENNWCTTVFGTDKTYEKIPGYEPAQLVLAKLELLNANNACGFKRQQPDEPGLHRLSQE